MKLIYVTAFYYQQNTKSGNLIVLPSFTLLVSLLEDGNLNSNLYFIYYLFTLFIVKK